MKENEKSNLEEKIREIEGEPENIINLLKEDYEILFNCTTDSLCLIEVIDNDKDNDNKDFKYIRNNTSHELKTGLKKSDIAGKTPVQVFGKETGEIILQNYMECMLAKDSISYEEKIQFTKEDKYWETTLHPVLIDDKVKYIISSGKDITKQKKLQNEKEILIEELRYSNETKDRFFSIIAHDLKSPFIGIFGYLKILKEDFKDLSDEKKLENIQVITNCAKNTYNLLEDLLEWATLSQTKEAYSPEKINLKKIVSQNQKLYNTALEQNEINFFNFVENKSYIYADYKMTSSIFRNLLSNSIKFTEKGGNIYVHSIDKKDLYRISFMDTGIGMEKNVLENLFELTNKKSCRLGLRGEKGTGLGLDLVKRYTHIQGGKIDVESYPGQGTIFNLYLPKAKE